MTVEYLGIYKIPQKPPGTFYVWGYVDELGELTHVHVGDCDQLSKASGTLAKADCDHLYTPILWTHVEERLLRDMNMDSGE